MAVIRLDALCDTGGDRIGEPCGHSNWVAEGLDEWRASPACYAQLGIRSAAERAARGHLRDQGGQIFSAHDWRGLDKPTQHGPRWPRPTWCGRMGAASGRRGAELGGHVGSMVPAS